MSQCNIDTGECGPVGTEAEEKLSFKAAPKTTALYITDPICSMCWVMEPGWRRLLLRYGERLAVRHLYGGLLPGWKGFMDAGHGIRGPGDVAHHWEEAARYFGQPIDPSVWVKDPLESSYPPSIAVHAARLLDPTREDAYLRRMRQILFLEARNIARPEVQLECAVDVGLDRERFAGLLASKAGEAGFQRDLEEVRKLPVGGFPTVIFVAQDGQAVVLRGTQPYERLERALLHVNGGQRAEGRPTAAELLARYRTGTTKEFAEALELSPAEAAKALEAAGARRKPLAGDALWSVS